MEYYTSLRMNNLLPNAVTYMNLINIMLRERNKTHERMCCAKTGKTHLCYQKSGQWLLLKRAKDWQGA